MLGLRMLEDVRRTDGGSIMAASNADHILCSLVFCDVVFFGYGPVGQRLYRGDTWESQSSRRTSTELLINS